MRACPRPDPSAWRNFRKPRSASTLRRIQALSPPCSIFTGYSVEVIAQWCCVGLRTARRYKDGRVKPSRAAVALFLLHRDGYVLPQSWQRQGFVFRRDLLFDPAGKAMSSALVEHYQVMLQLAHDCSRRTGRPEDLERYWELLKAAA